MSSISSLKLWKDVGYTEGSAETPKLTDTLPTADFTISTGINPDKDRIFSKLKLKMDFSDAIDCKYLRADFEMNNGEDVAFYGWIDGVSLRSDTTEYPMVEISWHIDMWRTYMNAVTFGRGQVLRRPRGSADPPQNHPVRFRIPAANPTEIIPKKTLTVDGAPREIWYVVFSYNVESSGGQVVGTRMAFFPFLKDHAAAVYLEDNSHYCPSLDEIYKGSWDELLNLTPSRINAAFISPMAPINMTGSGSAADPLKKNNLNWSAVTVGSYRYYQQSAGTGVLQDLTNEFSVSITAVTPDDFNDYIITGFDGETLGSLPFGISTGTTVKSRVIMSSTAAYIQIRFAGIDSHVMGQCITIPLPTLDNTENSYSEYNYTGSRDYDRAQLAEGVRYQKEFERVQGTTSLVSGVFTTGLGIAAGNEGAAMAGGSLLAEGIGQLLGQGVANVLQLEDNHNGNLDRIANDYMTRQSDGLLCAGSGFDCLFHGRVPVLVNMVMDTYSQTRAEDCEASYGIEVNECHSSCQSLVSAGGALMIDNLNLTGNVPIEAIKYIKTRFKRGVLLI